jgi:CRP-like cAMP-binding protein
MTGTRSTAGDNWLLAAIPPRGFGLIEGGGLELIQLPLGQVLHEPGVKMRHVYFPVKAIVSLICVIQNGASSEIALIGNDGMVGIATLLGGGSMPNRAVVQSAGSSYRVRTSVMAEAMDRSEATLHVLLRYTQTLIAQMCQTAACNRHHSIEQQLCRCLLMRMDRLHLNELVMTQEQIANMLGVRREGVTEAAGKLQRAGVIRYCRGRINVRDRTQLERLACECYREVKRETDRLRSPAYPADGTPRAVPLRPPPPPASAFGAHEAGIRGDRPSGSDPAPFRPRQSLSL